MGAPHVSAAIIDTEFIHFSSKRCILSIVCAVLWVRIFNVISDGFCYFKVIHYEIHTE